MAKAKTIKREKKERAPSAIYLYIFLVPLFLSTIISLFDGDYKKFILKLISFFLLYGSINLINKGLKQELEYNKALIAKAPKIKYKLFGALGVGASVALLSFLVDKLGIINSIATTILAIVGVMLYYGKDPSEDKLPKDSSINYDKLLIQLKEAQDKIENIEKIKEDIEDKELKLAISKAINRANEILDTIKKEPKDIRVARKFMVVYLDGIKEVIDSYNSLENHQIDSSYRVRLIELLDDASNRFEKELEKLRNNDLFDLDVQIDTLKKQLKE